MSACLVVAAGATLTIRLAYSRHQSTTQRNAHSICHLRRLKTQNTAKRIHPKRTAINTNTLYGCTIVAFKLVFLLLSLVFVCVLGPEFARTVRLRCWMSWGAPHALRACECGLSAMCTAHTAVAQQWHRRSNSLTDIHCCKQSWKQQQQKVCVRAGFVIVCVVLWCALFNESSVMIIVDRQHTAVAHMQPHT